MTIPIIQLLLAVTGLLVFVLSERPKASQLGLALFTAAAMAFLVLCGGPAPRL